MPTKNDNTYYDPKQQLVSRKTGNPVKLLPDTSRMFNSNVYCDKVNYDILKENEVMIVLVFEAYDIIPS